MAMLKVKFDNILCFDNFVADFTYPKRLVKSTLDNEYLINYPNIRYKKVNIILGSNGTGKTCLGKAIWRTLLFLNNLESNPLKEIVGDKSKDAYILIDAAFPDGRFFRVELKILTDGNLLARHYEHTLRKDDTYLNIIKSFDPLEEFKNYLEVLNKTIPTGFNINFPSNEKGFDIIDCKYPKEYKEEFCDLYEKLIKIFDKSIEKVFVSKELEDTYVVKFSNGHSVAVTHGNKLSELSRLSSGTKNVINIAGLIFSIKKHFNGLYYADEQFSYVNSDIEKACLTLMSSLLGDGEQLFFTSHNEEILDTSLPLHSYNFLKKIKGKKNEFSIHIINGGDYEKRNNVNIKNLYDNDYFDIAPETYSIHELGDN